MHVGERHDVGGDGAVVGLFGAWSGEGAWDEEAGGWVGRRWRTVRMERTAVVAGGAELVSMIVLVWRVVIVEITNLRQMEGLRGGCSTLTTAIESFAPLHFATDQMPLRVRSTSLTVPDWSQARGLRDR